VSIAAWARAARVSHHVRVQGIEEFLEPGRDVLVARDAAKVANLLNELTPERASVSCGNTLTRTAPNSSTH
jgi:hypothetical protein